MKPIQITIEAEPYTTTKWYSAMLSFSHLQRDSSEETEEEYKVSIAVAGHQFISSRTAPEQKARVIMQQ